MSHSPRDPQTRLPLTKPLAEHDQRCAASLVAKQYLVLTATGPFTDEKDTALIDATSAAANAILPVGSAEIVGLPFRARKVDSSSNAASLACSGSDTFADATTSLTTTTEGVEVGAEWDGAHWRPLAQAGGGAVSGDTLTATTSVTVGDSFGSPSITLDKSKGGTARINLLGDGDLRGRLELGSTENMVFEIYGDDGETLLGAITLNGATGAITLSKGTTITTGGLTISAGGLTVTAGGISLVAGNLVLTAGVRAALNLPSAVDDAGAAALSPAVPVGGLYHTAGAVKQRLA